MAKKKIVYVNRFTGDVQIVTKQSAKQLSEDYSEVRFIKNQEGKSVMRFELEGATVDVSEKNEAQEGKVDGVRSPKKNT